MKATATAPSNIAFVKYWGKRDGDLRLPLNTSFSMTTDAAFTTTTVEFSDAYQTDRFEYAGGESAVPAPEKEVGRVAAHLDRIRTLAGLTHAARVVSRNSFPKGTGAASSASGFAALTVAAAAAAGLSLTERELTVLARQGSGSACRSIPDGFVEWVRGGTSPQSYAVSLFPHTHWELADVLAVVSDVPKAVGSTEGMDGVLTSPFWMARARAIPDTLHRCIDAVKRRDFAALGAVIEAETVSMHAVMMTQTPPLFYWSDATVRIMREVAGWRESGIPVYYTIDAGPNVHLICPASDTGRVAGLVQSVPGVLTTLTSRITGGTRLTDTHLF
jgi:diphosphomevalonate decarboxylase